MIFVLESLLRSRRAKTRAWKEAGRKWVNENNARSGYINYSFNDYKRSHPSPVHPIGEALAVVLPIIGTVAVAGFLIAWVATRPPKPVDPNNPYDCSVVVKKGDKVAVSGGDFDGSEGDVIEQREDCTVNLRLTKSTWSFDICKKQDSSYTCGSTKENGTILGVDHNGDLIKL